MYPAVTDSRRRRQANPGLRQLRASEEKRRINEQRCIVARMLISLLWVRSMLPYFKESKSNRDLLRWIEFRSWAKQEKTKILLPAPKRNKGKGRHKRKRLHRNSCNGIVKG